MRTSRYFLPLLLSLLLAHNTFAQQDTVGIANADSTVRRLKWLPRRVSSADVRVDAAGPLMSAIGIGFMQYEVGARIGIKNRYFPIFEFGVGTSDHTGETTGKNCHVSAPYFRLGCDYNFTKPNRHDSRFTLGVRYAFSGYSYDLYDPAFVDEVWKDARPLSLKGESGHAQWLEAVGSVETRLWRFVHLGWSVRYKIRLSQKASDYGEPWYVPGFGINGDNTWGANFNLIFEI